MNKKLSCREIAQALGSLIENHKLLMTRISDENYHVLVDAERVHNQGKLAIDEIVYFLIKISNPEV